MYGHSSFQNLQPNSNKHVPLNDLIKLRLRKTGSLVSLKN
ncbi:hypothetical protein D2M30_1523 [Bacillus amyloliquefaciens]|nr:hypothetical protein D2M30_1523 [Bacillus amyloliquefaciens]